MFFINHNLTQLVIGNWSYKPAMQYMQYTRNLYCYHYYYMYKLAFLLKRVKNFCFIVIRFNFLV